MTVYAFAVIGGLAGGLIGLYLYHRICWCDRCAIWREARHIERWKL